MNPPKSFLDYLKSEGVKKCPEGYKQTIYWRAFKAGYNAAVEVVNKGIKNKYKMPGE
jgi:hypothetical protein